MKSEFGWRESFRAASIGLFLMRPCCAPSLRRGFVAADIHCLKSVDRFIVAPGMNRCVHIHLKKSIAVACGMTVRTLIGFIARVAIVICLVQEPVALAQVPVDFSNYDTSCGVDIGRSNDDLAVRWAASDGVACAVIFNIEAGPGHPLLKVLSLASATNQPQVTLAQDIDVDFRLAVGSRTSSKAFNKGIPYWPYVFFDQVSASSHESPKLDLRRVRVESAGERATITFSSLSCTSFAGDLVCEIYSGSPLLHLSASMEPNQGWTAYLYDPTLVGRFPTVAYMNLSNLIVRATPPTGPPTKQQVRNRTIMAEYPAGTLAVFPPPHAYFYPTDLADNMGYVQLGANEFGIREEPRGDNRYWSWINGTFGVPLGRRQNMDFFLLLSADQAGQTLERVKQYTHGDAYKSIPGYVTFADHFHPELTMHESRGEHVAQVFTGVMKGMNVQICELAEFHVDGNPGDTGRVRLDQLRDLFTLCQSNSTPNFLLLPGEEANCHFGEHWMYLFPKPVYFIKSRSADKPFSSQVFPYGTVYRVGDSEEMYNLLKRKNGLAWACHARCKASQHSPDQYAFQDFFKDDSVFLGCDWKALPSDLSEPHLGYRVFDLLDDMCQWGDKKRILGCTDVFEVDSNKELYANMSVNYLHLDSVPPFSDWSPVVNTLRDGDFFGSTGEVLFRSLSIQSNNVAADVDWTFPLAFAMIVWGESNQVKRLQVPLPKTREFGRQQFSWPVDLRNATWARLEVCDVARNIVFSQPTWFKEPVALIAARMVSLTLINADTSLPITGYDPLRDGSVLSFADLPTTNLNLRANPTPFLVGSVKFGYDTQASYHVGSEYPYSLVANNAGIYKGMTPEIGSHTVIATPYSGPDAKGTAGETLILHFSVVAGGLSQH